MTPAGVAGPPGWRVVHCPVVDSTQAVARALLEAGEGRPIRPDAALVVHGGEQTGGRGRHGRAWTSPPGNLYVTVAFPCPEGPRLGVEIGFVAGVALVETLAALGFGSDARLKWPNDVLLGGAKVAGLLLESVADADGIGWVLLGMGVNVASAPPPGVVPYPATALNAHPAGDGVTPEAVLDPLLGRLADLTRQWRAHGFQPVREAWLRHGLGLGETVGVRLGPERVVGVFEGLNPDGALILREPSGDARTILAGDVFFPTPGED
jgi:BirA family biotin operon repressor/biotin-[acetyl-CoA-carboxylase] ligase